nr:putative ribonuclease H-like domain-containing protein [Tanacetum cinerariifolium]
TPPVSAGSTPPMSPCASPISADRHSISTGKSHVSAGRPTSFAGRLVSAGRPSGSADRTPFLLIFNCPKSGIFTSSSYDKEFSGPDANNLESSRALSMSVLPSPRGSIIFILLLEYLALADPDWVKAMQAEMQQFGTQKVWVLVTLPDGKRAIGTKWILKNKRDARGIICRNKDRLVVTPPKWLAAEYESGGVLL